MLLTFCFYSTIFWIQIVYVVVHIIYFKPLVSYYFANQLQFYISHIK